MSDPVDTLLAVEEGQEVRLEAKQYEFKSPFEVTEVSEESWTMANGGVWNARTVTLEPGHHRGTTREFDVFKDGSPPNLGDGYGALVSVEIVGEEGADDQDGDREDDDEVDVTLPDDVTDEDIRKAAREHTRLGDVAEAIGVTRGRARTITVALGVYSEVRDLPAGGRA